MFVLAQTIEQPLTIAAVFGCLLIAVGILWKINQAQVKKIEYRWEQCETTHKESQEKLIEIAGEMNFLKGQMDGHKQAREDLQQMDGLMADVLKEVHTALKRRGNNDGTAGNAS